MTTVVPVERPKVSGLYISSALAGAANRQQLARIDRLIGTGRLVVGGVRQPPAAVVAAAHTQIKE